MMIGFRVIRSDVDPLEVFLNAGGLSTVRTPDQSRVYQCHHFDSTRWNYYSPRDDDIIIGTSYKAGTTWTQGIVANLLFPDGNFPAPPAEMSPWIDMRLVPLELFLNGIEAQTHRRYLKTHLPLDGMRYEPQVKYVYVSRDGRDVFMSLWNHYSNMTEETITHMNSIPGRVGDPFPPAPDDIHEFWATWATQNWLEGEAGGWPYWSHVTNVQSWWDYRHLPNIEFFHYNDLLNDTEGEVKRLAEYLEIEVPEQWWPRILKAISFEDMKSNAEAYVPDGGSHWKGGAQTFMNKGINGRWREVLTSEELAQYDALCDKALTPDCRQWLEFGRGG